MKNPFKNKFKNRWLRLVSNRYVLITLFFIVWMIFLDNYSYFDQRILNEEIQELEDNKQYYKDEIKKDNQSIKMLKSKDQVEKFAREKYYMKRDSEDIYIIEYEGDTIKKGL
ncbi:FtsB family cell division protein [Flavobacterium sp. 3HN19-14]|uniref:FtsB family cell division protein n=1 Tax=Flavobacterium sp. 3HN19-14 TaxID=3448133 RepID=UPI003EE386D4